MAPPTVLNHMNDQFAFSEQVGFITSRKLVRIIRNLHVNGPMGEGVLAQRCDSRVFYPEWGTYIEQLQKWGFIKLEPTGHGGAQTVELDEKGKAWVAERLPK
jgi:hypothetical protein